MSKELYAKKLIQCLDDSINREDLDVNCYRMALALAFLSLQKDNIVIDDKDITIFSGCSKDEIKEIITNICNGNFQMDDNNFIVNVSSNIKMVSFDEIYHYIDNHITPRVNRYRSPLLSFYNHFIDDGKIATDDALDKTIFYQVNISGHNLAVYEIENDIEKWMGDASRSKSKARYIDSYRAACEELKKRLEEKYPGCKIIIRTTSYGALSKKNKKHIKPNKKVYDSYDEYYKDLVSRRKKSLTNLISNCYHNLDDKASRNLLLQIYGLAIFLLNSNLSRTDYEEVYKNTINIEGYSIDAFKNFASNRMNACERSIDGFIKHSLSGSDKVSLHNYSHNRSFDCINYRGILQDNSIVSPILSGKCLEHLFHEKNEYLHLLIEWQNKLYDAHTEKDFIIIKNTILIYLQRLSEIEARYLYFKADALEIMQIIKGGLSHTGGVIVSDDHLAFSTTDNQGELQGFAGCSLISFIKFLSFGIGEDQYSEAFQFSKK